MNPHTRSITVILREEMKWTMIATNKIKRALRAIESSTRSFHASRYLSLSLSLSYNDINDRTNDFMRTIERDRQIGRLLITIKSGQSLSQI